MNNKEDSIILTFEEYEKNVYFQLLIHSLVFANDINDYMCQSKINTIDKSLIFNCLYVYLKSMQATPMFNYLNKQNIIFLLDYTTGIDNEEEKLKENEMLNEMKIIFNNLDDNNFDFFCEQIVLRDYGAFNYKANLRKIKKLGYEKIALLEKEYYQSIENDFPIFTLLSINGEEDFNKHKNFLLLKDFYRSINYFLVAYPTLFLNPKYLDRVKAIIEINDIYMNDNKALYNFDSKFLDLSNITKAMVKKFERKIR